MHDVRRDGISEDRKGLPGKQNQIAVLDPKSRKLYTTPTSIDALTSIVALSEAVIQLCCATRLPKATPLTIVLETKRMSLPQRKPYNGTQRKLVIGFDVAYLTNKLRESRFGQPEDIDVMTKYFDKTTKPSFKGSPKPYFIRFGRNENDPEFEIRSGSVKINGTQITDFFEPAVHGIIRVIEEQSLHSAIPINTIFMVGGFAASDYLFSKLSEHFKTKKLKILRPDTYLNKAVAEGAVSFSIDHSVASRVSRYTYGIECNTQFDANKPDHVERHHTCFERLDGRLVMPDYFSPILIKDTHVSEEKEFRKPYMELYTKSEFHELTTSSIPIKCYRNRRGDAPAWIDLEPDLFPDVCMVTADFSQIKKLIRSRTTLKTGIRYYRLNFDIILLFGLTELKAQIAWIKDGQEKRGPASIVYDVTSVNAAH
ncbi:hypothetical protein APHAL10511_003530 [Amanita phalloides]|nr:hypothetical protein APHAL10511_003530 [Amanita phalloides]